MYKVKATWILDVRKTTALLNVFYYFLHFQGYFPIKK
jgi:hypothetical protein